MGRSLILLTEKACPVTLICVTCNVVEPIFRNVKVELALWPTGTEPNEIMLGEAEREPACAAVPTIMPPPQPDNPRITLPNAATRKAFLIPHWI
jgi:hypothetical protein